jgi:hypothetical protein
MWNHRRNGNILTMWDTSNKSRDQQTWNISKTPRGFTATVTKGGKYEEVTYQKI